MNTFVNEWEEMSQQGRTPNDCGGHRANMKRQLGVTWTNTLAPYGPDSKMVVISVSRRPRLILEQHRCIIPRTTLSDTIIRRGHRHEEGLELECPEIGEILIVDDQGIRDTVGM